MQTEAQTNTPQAPQRRLTKQRKIILEELTKLSSHPTADELYQVVRQRIPNISLGTVYRNLDFLVDQGQIARIDASAGQKRFDALLEYHQHVRCLKCGCIGDVFTLAPLPCLEALHVPGFTLTASRVEFEGICDNCAA